MRWLIAAAALALTTHGCGYRVAGRGDLVPSNVRTIAIPAFANNTTRYPLTENLPAAIGREFISRTRYRVVAKPENADAVLQGAVLNYISYPAVVDTARSLPSAPLDKALSKTNITVAADIFP